MKNKAICILSCLFVLIITLTVSIHFTEKKEVYHQHIENKNHPECETSELFCTHLPIISIDTGKQKIPGEARDGKVITTNVKIYNQKDKVNYLTDKMYQRIDKIGKFAMLLEVEKVDDVKATLINTMKDEDLIYKDEEGDNKQDENNTQQAQA